MTADMHEQSKKISIMCSDSNNLSHGEINIHGVQSDIEVWGIAFNG